jgi:diamine N-acetyltransferase
MSDELLDRINEAELPEPLQAALRGLAQALEPVLPTLPDHPQHMASRLFGRVLEEAADPATETHWWEANLDLAVKTVGNAGGAVGGLQQAAARVAPLMHERMGPYEEVTLREITEQTVWGICMLSDTLTEPQKYYVAPNAISIAQGHFSPHAWIRAIYAGPAPVGFLMLYDNPDEPEYFLWRLMIAEPYHGRGYGRQAVERLVEYVKTRPGAKELLVSYHKGEKSPEGFYLKLGFEPTGEIIEGEHVARLALD